MIVKVLPIIFGVSCLLIISPSTHAATFNPSSIISDGIFTNKDSMSLNDIQTFIQAKGVGCVDGEAPCLKNFSENGRSSAQIIYDTAQQFNINPQTLIATLQKETALLTKDRPGAWRYRTAMGYGCPDSTPGVCDASYYGFSNQMTWAARMFRAIMNNSPSWYTPYVLGNNFIYWNPDYSCDGTVVNIENRATQALYNYTPYQPNAAALNAGYGTGDECSSYGNRNFFNYFNDWFGSPTIDGRIYVEQIDNVSDIDGESAQIGFRLNFRPDFPVTILVSISNPSIAGVVGNVDRVVIQPDNWNSPEKNLITFYGKDDGSAKTKQFTVQTTEAASYDPRFDPISGSDVGDPTIIVQSGDRAVYRLFSSTLNRHVFTSRQDEVSLLQSQGYNSEGVAFYACEAGTQNIGRISKSGITLMVDSSSSEYKAAINNGFRLDGALYSVSNTGQTPLYRLRNQNSNYLYTTSTAERDLAVSKYGYTFEGATFNSCDKNDKPVFRLVNMTTGNHFYTQNPSERDYAGTVGFKSEGISFYIPSGVLDQPVYRLLSRDGRNHFYTKDASERQSALQAGYIDEGIAFNLPSLATKGKIYRLFSEKKGEHFYTFFTWERDEAINSGLYKDESTAFSTRN